MLTSNCPFYSNVVTLRRKPKFSISKSRKHKNISQTRQCSFCVSFIMLNSFHYLNSLKLKSHYKQCFDFFKTWIKDRLQISLLSEFNLLQPDVTFLYPLYTFRFSDVFRRFIKVTPGCNGLSELINFYSPWHYQRTYAILMFSGGIEVNIEH